MAAASVVMRSHGGLRGQVGLIVLAMVFARTAAMLANRILDASLDARNPVPRGAPFRRVDCPRASTGRWLVSASSS